MLRNRLFNVLIAILLALVIALTIREAAATAGIISQTNSTSTAQTLECASLPSRYSIHSEHVEGLNARVIYSEEGPTGIDGGLVELLSSYRTCSR